MGLKTMVTEIKCIVSIFLFSYFLYQHIFLYQTFSCTKISSCIELCPASKYLLYQTFSCSKISSCIKPILVPKYLLVSNIFLHQNIFLDQTFSCTKISLLLFIFLRSLHLFNHGASSVPKVGSQPPRKG